MNIDHPLNSEMPRPNSAAHDVSSEPLDKLPRKYRPLIADHEVLRFPVFLSTVRLLFAEPTIMLVPEAAVNEDQLPTPAEDQVRCPG